MINALRKKFIAISIITITLGVSLVFVFINYLNYYNIMIRNDEILSKFQNNHVIINEIISDTGRGIVSSDNYFYSGFIIAQIDKDNIVKKKYNVNTGLEYSEYISIIDKATTSGKDEGYVGYYKYGYLESDSYKYIVLIDCKTELRLFYQFLQNSILIGIGIVLVASILFIIISKKVVAPIEENYKKQKQFITDASHELKTPLTIISSNADVLEMEIGKSKWLSNIHNQIDRLTNLINSLVAFSRVEEKETLEKTKFSISELLKSRIEDFEELANFKGKHLIQNIQSDIYFNGDAQTIMQVIDILLDNAIKYADINSDIIIKLEKNNRGILLRIKNKTENVKKGDLSKVFDRFYRLDESRNSEIKGYGIGLSLANLIVERHKSKIKAYSPEDNIFVIDILLNDKLL